jgi:hypothetical protein
VGVREIAACEWNEWQEILLNAFERRLVAIREKGHQMLPVPKTLTASFLQAKDFKVPDADILSEAIRIIKAGEANDSRYDSLAMMGHRFGMVENIIDLKQYLQDINRSLKPEGQVLVTSFDTPPAVKLRQELDRGLNIQSGRCLGIFNSQLQTENLIGPFFGMFRIKAETLKSQAIITNWHCEIIYSQDDNNYLARLSMSESGQK